MVIFCGSNPSKHSDLLRDSRVDVVALADGNAAEEVLLVLGALSQVLDHDVGPHAEPHSQESRLGVEPLHPLRHHTELLRVSCKEAKTPSHNDQDRDTLRTCGESAQQAHTGSSPQSHSTLAVPTAYKNR